MKENIYGFSPGYTLALYVPADSVMFSVPPIVRIQIKNELIKLGYKFSNKGTIYIIDAIELAYNNENYLELISNLDKNIYSKLAKKYNVNLKTLESNITKATDNMNEFRKKHYSSKINDKITSKMVIWFILDKINHII